MISLIGTCVLAAGALAPASAAPATAEKASTVFAEKLYTSTGKVVEGALITIADGKIQAISPGAKAKDDSLRAAAVTAGLVDASVRIHPGRRSVEESVEVQADLRVVDTLDPFDMRWKRVAATGVTTVLASPSDENVIGGLSAVLKTGGALSIDGRLVRGDAFLRGAIGTQPSRRNHPAFGSPSDFYSRRPTTRMGVEWEWRKAFYDAEASKRHPERVNGSTAHLLQALDGKLPVMIQAWATQDIRTSVFLKEELEREGLGKLDLVIDAGAEAWREPELLLRSKTPVVLPPFSASGRTTDGAFMPWNLAKVLHDAGIVFALSGHGSRIYDQSIAFQASHAMRGGLPFEAALEAVTIVPARLLGVEDRVGSVEVGKDADLVLWSGTPLERTSSIVAVLLEGEILVHDAAGASQ